MVLKPPNFSEPSGVLATSGDTLISSPIVGYFSFDHNDTIYGSGVDNKFREGIRLISFNFDVNRTAGRGTVAIKLF